MTSGMDAQHVSMLRDWLTQQRWYGDKSRTLERLEVDRVLQLKLDSGPVAVILLDCQYTDGSTSTYFAPIQWNESEEGKDGSTSIDDAFSNPDFLGWLYSGFEDGRSNTGSEGRTMQWIAGAGSSHMPREMPPARVLQGEQSNTSVRFGDTAILKVFRKLQPGINPDPEILRFLSRYTGYRHAPADLGTLELRSGGSGQPEVLAAMQGFVPNSGDAWTWLLDALQARGGETFQLLEQIALLAHRTGDLHLALATPSDDPAFAVERIDAQYRERLHRRIGNELHRTMDAVLAANLRSSLKLSSLRDQLASMLAHHEVLDGLPLFRVHGDYHLGQVLRTDQDFVIIDFEGEPSRSFAERREKASPLKDVAGMVRSLDYAFASVQAQDVEREEGPPLADLAQQVQQTYTTAYMRSVSQEDGRVVPTDAGKFSAALSIFLIEKALYEVRYELDNRPDWTEIPLQALEALIGT